MDTSMCSELGCYNHLDENDHSRYPRSLSITVDVALRKVQKRNMRSRCSICYDTRYRGKYSAISYKWSHEERKHGVPVSLCNEAGKNLGWGRIPTLSKPLVDVTLATSMFFLDTLNTERGERVDWTLGNVYSTYANCKNVLCFENPSDRRINDEPLHLGGDRHRGPSLRSNYCRTERWIANSKNIPLIFYNGSGGTTTNLDRLGSRDGSNPDGTYQHRTLVTRGNTTFLTRDMTDEQRRERMRFLETNPAKMGQHLEELLSGAELFGYSNSLAGEQFGESLMGEELSAYSNLPAEEQFELFGGELSAYSNLPAEEQFEGSLFGGELSAYSSLSAGGVGLLGGELSAYSNLSAEEQFEESLRNSNLSMGTPDSTFLQPPTLGIYTDPLDSTLSQLSTLSLYTQGLDQQLNQPHSPSSVIDDIYGLASYGLSSYGLSLTQNPPMPDTLYTGNYYLHTDHSTSAAQTQYIQSTFISPPSHPNYGSTPHPLSSYGFDP